MVRHYTQNVWLNNKMNNNEGHSSADVECPFAKPKKMNVMNYYKLIIIHMFLIFVVRVNAQPKLLWKQTEFVKIAVPESTIALDRHLNTYMLTIQTDESPSGGFTLVKYDSLGNALWKQHSLSGLAGIIYGSFTVDSTGNAYVSQCYVDLGEYYDAEAVLVKYGADGSKKWEVNYSEAHTGNSYILYSDIDTINGRLITLGMNLNDTITAENFLYVQSVDTADGSIVWRKEMQGVFEPEGMRIQSDHIQILSTRYKTKSKNMVNTLIDFEGNVIAEYEKPYTSGNIDKNYISKTGDVIFGNSSYGYKVTRVNIMGDTLWTYVHPKNSSGQKNWSRWVVEDEFQNVYSTGSVEIPGEFLEMVTSKINIKGEIEWEEIFHLNSGDYGDGGLRLSVSNNKLVLSGYSNIQSSVSVGIIKIYNTADGKVEQELIISDDNTILIDNAFIKNNKLYFTGTGYQGVIAVGKVLAVTGCYQLPKTVSVSETNVKSSITTYPNPTADIIKVSDIDTGVFELINVYNAAGSLVASHKIGSSEEQISLSCLPSGLYTISIQGKGIRVNNKVTKR